MPTKHARYSPSKLEKLELCPCFKYSENQNTDAMEEGTLLHDATENEDKSNLENPEQEELVDSCLMMKESIRRVYKAEPYVEEHEIKVNVTDPADGVGLTYGTFDYAVRQGKKATIADWKFGAYPVTHAKDNIQGQSYVAGMFEEHPELEEIELMMVCPRQELATSHVYTRADLPRILLRIQSVIARAADEEKEPTPTEEACLRCGNKFSCHKLHEIAIQSGEGLNLPAEFDPFKLNIGDPETATRALALSYILEDWASQTRKRITQMAIEEDMEVPGFTVRRRRGNVSLSSPNLVFDVVKEKYGIELEDFLSAVSIPFSKLLKLVCESSEEEVDKPTVREELLCLLCDLAHENNEITYMQRSKRGVTNEEILGSIE